MPHSPFPRFHRLLVLLFVAGILAPAQSMSLMELRDTTARMVRLHVADAQLAARLRRVQPTEQVPGTLAEEAAEWGAGPLTLRELNNLVRKSASKPASQRLLPPVLGRRSQAEVLDGDPAVILESIRLYGEDYSHSIPNFLCYRNTSFLQGRTGIGDWKQHLQLRERLVHLEDGDHHEIVAVDGKEVDGEILLFHGGITVSGEFGNIIRRLFEEKTQTKFYWLGEEEGGEERLVSLAFRVERENSSMELSSGDQKIKSGYRGELTASAETGQIFRIRLFMDESPREFPIRGASWDIRYAPVKVEEQELLLPVSATTEAYQQGAFMRNEATYTDYQKYSAESSIQFGSSLEDASDY